MYTYVLKTEPGCILRHSVYLLYLFIIYLFIFTMLVNSTEETVESPVHGI